MAPPGRRDSALRPGAVDAAARRRALREVARRHHPDVGGDAETYLAAVRAVEARFGSAGARPAVPLVHIRPARRWRLVLRRLRRQLLRLQRERHRGRQRRADATLRARKAGVRAGR